MYIAGNVALFMWGSLRLAPILCVFNTWTSPQNELCVAFGPGRDMFDSTRIIGERQYSLGKVKGSRKFNKGFNNWYM